MKHLDSQGHEFELRPEFPAQDLDERMGVMKSAPIAAGELSPEFRAILETEDGIDFDKFHFAIRSQEGMGKAYAVAESSSPLRKSKTADFLEADSVLREFTENHDKKTLHSQLGPLVERACAKLSKEHGELLRKAHAVLDLSLLSFFLGRAFAQ